MTEGANHRSCTWLKLTSKKRTASGGD